MPTQMPLQPAERRLGQNAKVPFFDISIVDIVRDSVREDVVSKDIRDSKPSLLQKLPGRSTRVRIGDRAARLCFGVASDEFVQPQHPALAVDRQDLENLPGRA